MSFCIGTVGWGYYAHWRTVNLTRAALNSVVYGSDPWMKYAYESWLNGLDRFGFLNQQTIIVGASHSSLKRIEMTDIYLIGRRRIVSAEFDGRKVPIEGVGETKEYFYENPQGLLHGHLSFYGKLPSVVIEDSAGCRLVVERFVPLPDKGAK
jgi:hypothetical protein